MNRGITQKQYLELVPPTEEDARSSQMRILERIKRERNHRIIYLSSAAETVSHLR